MKQKFVALYGNAVIENEKLYLSSIYQPFGKTAFAVIGYELFIPAIFVLQFLMREGPRMYTGILIWGLILAFRIPSIYDVLFKRSYSNRIPLHRVQLVSFAEDPHGIETYVTLHLKNGRYKKIIFRKLENQHESFLEAVSIYTAQSQLA